MVKSFTLGGLLPSAIWKKRNKACFEGKIIKNPLEIFCYACALMNFWAGLFADSEKKQLEDGVTTMLKIANELLAVQRGSEDLRVVLNPTALVIRAATVFPAPTNPDGDGHYFVAAITLGPHKAAVWQPRMER